MIHPKRAGRGAVSLVAGGGRILGFRCVPCSLGAFLLGLLLGFRSGPLIAADTASYTKFCASCGFATETFGSHSGQFSVHGSMVPLVPNVLLMNQNPGLIEMEPQWVAATAERLKRALLNEMQLHDTYKHRIHISLVDSANPDESVRIVTKQYPDGFFYQVGMPTRMNSLRFVRAVVQTLLLELANRHGRRGVELPAWIVDGFTLQVLSSVQPTFVANKTPVTLEILGYDRVATSRRILRTNSVLTFHELSFPSTVSPAVAPEVFQACAHLFVNELLGLRDGPALMARFLAALPGALNWQTAFYQSYQPRFTRALDVEKWWALTAWEFQNREKPEKWPVGLSQGKLEAALQTALEYRASSNSLPELRQLRLQQLLSETDFSVQEDAIRLKLQQLYFLSFHLAPETIQLASAYDGLLSNYVKERSSLSIRPGLKSAPEAKLEALLKTTLRRLDELDERRQKLASDSR